MSNNSAFSIAVFVTAVFCICIGGYVYFSNRSRPSNQSFLFFSLLSALWLSCVFQSSIISVGSANIIEKLRWTRANAAVGALLPWALWIVKESILSTTVLLRSILIRSFPWIVVSIFQIYLTYIPQFVYTLHTSPTLLQRGFPYIIYHLLGMVSCATMLLQSTRQIREQVGFRRAELQFITITAIASSGIMFSLNFAGNMLRIAALNRLTLLILVLNMTLTGWGISHYNIFTARIILLTLFSRLIIMAIVALAVLSITRLLAPFGYSETILFFLTMVSAALGIWLHEITSKKLDISGQIALGKVRSAINNIAATGSDHDILLGAFEVELARQFKCAFASILTHRDSAYAGRTMILQKESVALESLYKCGWITAGQIERQLIKWDVRSLASFMSHRKVALLVSIPTGRLPSLIIALGEKIDGWVFTYPEVQRIQLVGELIDNSLAHGRLVSQAQMKARMEYLAFMSRGLAHDLKNLMTPVSSFIINAEKHIDFAGFDAEAHAAASRSSRLMEAYVREVMSFGDRLEPNLTTLFLDQITNAVIRESWNRAKNRGITIIANEMVANPFRGDSVLLQRMFTNIVNNAIDASANGSQIIISLRDYSRDKYVWSVRDSGSGIPQENLSRVFEPYFTTKQIGDSSRGFGLGLTVAQKIAHLHRGEISIESSLGSGTCVEILLPHSREAQDGPMNEVPCGLAMSSST